jgi:hypothetical protein
MAGIDSYTKLMLHMNGADGSTTFTDESGKTWTAAGDAQRDTAAKKFGTASGLFDGTGDYISTPDHDDWNLGSGNFTIDLWVFLNSVSGVQIPVGQRYDSNNRWNLYFSFPSQGLGFYWKPTESYLFQGSSSGWEINTWYHVAVVRNGNEFKLYRDGIAIAAQTLAGSIPDIAGALYIGGTADGMFNGHIDEVRLSKGIARWTENFTPPSEEYSALETAEVSASIQVPTNISASMIRGRLGDISGAITVSPSISAHLFHHSVAGAIVVPVSIGADLTHNVIEGPISIPVTMSGTVELSGISAAITVPVQISGTMYATDPARTITATIPVPISFGGTLGDVNYPVTSGISIIPAISGTVYVYDVVTADLVTYLPSLEMSASAIADTIGNGYMTLPALTMDATGLTAYIGNALITLPRLTITATAMRTIIGAATLRLPALKTLASTLIGIVANGEITLPIMRVSADSYRSTIATGLVTLPSLRLDSTLLPTAYTNMVINVRNAALTLYTNYGFNSMCHFDGKNLGATATGIHDLDLGDSDVGVAIEWNFKTGYIDLHLKTKKKLREAWLGCKATGDMIVTITDTDGTAYEYEAKSYEETERGLRVKFGRGYHRRYFSIDVKNSDGGSITLDAIRLILDKYGGRR